MVDVKDIIPRWVELRQKHKLYDWRFKLLNTRRVLGKCFYKTKTIDIGDVKE